MSIILPTYDRGKFLPQALESIRSQSFADWELIVVDDGSTDNTRTIVELETRGIPQPARYHYQENQGAYGARNTGIGDARGEYLAFFDSDDYWLPHHLADCVEALDANPDVDWVYGAGRIVNYQTDETIVPNTFYKGGEPRPFLGLKTRSLGRLRILDDPGATLCMIKYGLFCGLQKSLIRRTLFSGYRFCTRHRNEGEDVLAALRAITQGYRFAYFDEVHVVYRVHDENSSAANPASDVDKKRRVYDAYVKRYEEIREELDLTAAESRAFSRNLCRWYFWILGYESYWKYGQRAEALRLFRRGLRCWAWDYRCWKTYMASEIRYKLNF